MREMEDELHARIDDETWNLYLKMSDLAGEAQRMLGEALYLQAQKIGSICFNKEEEVKETGSHTAHCAASEQRQERCSLLEKPH